MAGGIATARALSLADNYAATTTFRPGELDKLDVQVFTNDAIVQFLLGDGNRYGDELPLRAGYFRSIPGLGLLYDGDVRGFRFRNQTPGAVSVVDFWGYLR